MPAVPPGDLLVFRFWQWYQYGTGDSGKLQISVGAGTNWWPWETLAVAAPTNGSSGTWKQFVADLTPYQGQQIRLSFLHTANSDASVGAGWYIDEVELSDFTPTPMQLAQNVTGTFNASGQRAYYVLNAPPGGHLMLNFTGPAGSRTEVYVRRGALPSAGAYDYRVTNPGEINQPFVPDAQAGPWYVMVYADSVPTPGQYTLRADFLTGIFLTDLTPTHSGNSGPVTVDIAGAGFDSTAWAYLVNTNTWTTNAVAANVAFVSPSRLVADFDLTALPINVYQLTVKQGTNSGSLPFQVSQAIGPRLETHLIVPSQVGRHAPATIYVEYANTGDTAMTAPLLVLTGTERPMMMLAEQAAVLGVVRGFWTSARPYGYSETVYFFAGGESPGLLQPGESRRMPIQFVGLEPPWSWNPSVRFDLGVLDESSTNAVDWNSLKTNMRPATISAEVWEPLWNNFVAQTGSTWGDFLRMLNQNSVYLGRLGQDVKDMGALLAFEFAQADGLNVVRQLAASTDGYAPTPGLRLSFERVFSQTISQRYALGVLGRGWSHNWETTLSVAHDVPDHPEQSGSVTITGPAVSRRVFQPDSRDGSYFPQAGDHATLTALGADAFTLREAHGLLRAFRADGKLDYVQDPNGNRITATYGSGRLTRLTHSAGQTLRFTYNGAGRIATITDPVGRQTTFTYTGDHLTSVNYFDGSVVRYTYSAGQSVAREHALTQVEYPGGNHEYFTYDAQGKLTSMSRDGGAEAISFSYDNAGMVAVSDAFTNTTKFYLDHRGLLAKVENPLKNPLRLSYDDEYNLTAIIDPAGRWHSYAYDSAGNLTQSTDPLGNSTRFSYDLGLNRLATLMDAKGNMTRYQHDTQGNLRSITYADGSAERWGYDATGNPITWTNRRGQPIVYQFNTNGQLTAKLYPDGTAARYTNDARGNLIAATNIAGPITLDYNAQDRLHRITYPGSRWLEFTYDAAGRRVSSVDQLGYRLGYIYDAVGRLERMTNSVGTEIVHYNYDDAGRLARKTLGNGVFTTYAYDAVGQLLSLTNSKPGNSVLSFFNYTYDSRGRRTVMATHYGNWTYEYDDLSQLTHAVLASTDAQITNQYLRYVYDAMGNRTRTVENGLTTDYTANNLNQYVGVGTTSYAFDLDGNLIREVHPSGTITNLYGAECKLLQSSSTLGVELYRHDALGRTVSVSESGSVREFVVDPLAFGNVISEYSGTGSLVSRYDHGLGLISRQPASGGTISYAFDPLGNAESLVSESGSPMNRYAYGPFGTTLKRLESEPNMFRFGGEFGGMQTAQQECLLRARSYLPELGHFLSEDPFGAFAVRPNLYTYCRNQPTRYVDPTGLKEVPEWYDVLGTKEYMMNDLAPISPFWAGMWGTSWDVLTAVVFPLQSAQRFGEGIGRGGSPGMTILSGVDMAVSAVGPLIPEMIAKEVIIDVYKPSVLEAVYYGGFADAVYYSGKLHWEINPFFEGTAFWELFGSDIFKKLYELYSQSASAVDPNALVGPAGYGPAHFVRADSLLPYTIHFENETNATAPAQRVVISDRLTNRLDWTTFELTEIAFGDQFIAVPPHTQHFEKTEKLAQNGFNFEVQIEAGIHLDTGEVYAHFQSLNSTNGLPPPVDIGMLPPENGTGRGQGHISYVIRAHTNLVTGTEIRNVAWITFDQQPAIATDFVDPHDSGAGIDTNKQALVTIDADLPTSQVIAPSGTATNANFTVCWSGSDLGSGIAGYDIYVSTNGGPWTLWLANTPLHCETFSGENERTYSFYSVAHDGTGNTELPPSSPDITAVTLPNYPPYIMPVPTNYIVVGRQLVITNKAIDPDTPITFSLDATAPAGTAITTNGIFKWTPVCAQGSTTNFITLWATDSGRPAASNWMTFVVIVHECIEASLGNTVVQTGQTSSVPVRLLSTTELTNLAFTVVYQPERLTNFTLTVNSPQVLTQRLQSLTAGQVQVSFTLPSDSVLHGPTNVGELGFTALPGQPSAFVPLPITDVTGLKPDGEPVGNAYGLPGRVVVVGERPLLEALPGTTNTALLVLYGHPGSNYLLQTMTNELSVPAWQPAMNLSPTNLETWMSWPNQDEPMRFFRVRTE